jgi:hypothetical protein
VIWKVRLQLYNLISNILSTFRTMKSFAFLPILFLILLSCVQEKKNGYDQVADQVNDTHEITNKIILPSSLESRRAEFEKYVLAAQKRIKGFADKYQWDSLGTESYFDSVMVFDKKEAFDKTLLDITDSDPTIQLPKTYCAALEKRILIVVSPELYSKNYPEGMEENSYEKLLTHEIAHRLHIRILNNNEDLMGPIWFYEGFAIYAADQFVNSKTELSNDELWAIIKTTERGSYEKYGYIFRHFVKTIPLNTLINKAGESDFDMWLQTEINSIQK